MLRRIRARKTAERTPYKVRLKQAIPKLRNRTELLTFALMSIIALGIILWFLMRLQGAPDPRLPELLRNVLVTLGALSALSFGWARAIDDDKESKAEVIYVGERYLRAGLLTAIAIVLDTFALQTAPNGLTSSMTLEQWLGVGAFYSSIITLALGTVTYTFAAVVETFIVLHRRAVERRKALDSATAKP